MMNLLRPSLCRDRDERPHNLRSIPVAVKNVIAFHGALRFDKNALTHAGMETSKPSIRTIQLAKNIIVMDDGSDHVPVDIILRVPSGLSLQPQAHLDGSCRSQRRWACRLFSTPAEREGYPQKSFELVQLYRRMYGSLFPIPPSNLVEP
jgi:hypothetical protein